MQLGHFAGSNLVDHFITSLHNAKMRFCIRLILLGLIPLLVHAQPAPSELVSRKYRNTVQARIDSKYALLIDRSGSRSLVPLEGMRAEDLAWFKELSRHSSIERGNTSVKVVSEAEQGPAQIKAKKTILRATKIDGVEQVQLCAPNVFQDQIGGTCMLYARVHWLDIAGYYTSNGEIYKIINGTPPSSPWVAQKYVKGLYTVIYDRPEKPTLHEALPYGDNFEWARGQLRLGRPILAALPREIWQALPVDFLAERIWSGGSVGHQIVVNGFTYDPATDTGTFHVVNSWSELTEFDLKLRDARNGNLVFEHSISPYGEKLKAPTKEIVQSIRLLKSAGSSNLYQVTTNKGTRSILAPDEATARKLVEEDSKR